MLLMISVFMARFLSYASKHRWLLLPTLSAGFSGVQAKQGYVVERLDLRRVVDNTVWITQRAIAVASFFI